MTVESCCTSNRSCFFWTASHSSFPFVWSLLSSVLSAGEDSVFLLLLVLTYLPSKVSVLLYTSLDMFGRTSNIKCFHVCTVDCFWWWLLTFLCLWKRGEGYEESSKLKQVKLLGQLTKGFSFEYLQMKCQTMRRRWKEVGGGMEISSVMCYRELYQPGCILECCSILWIDLSLLMCMKGSIFLFQAGRTKCQNCLLGAA